MKINNAPIAVRPKPTDTKSAEFDNKMKTAARLYEQQFLGEMVKAMRATVQQSGLTEQSMAEKMYQDQVYDKYVEEWGKNGGVGFANIIYQQLKEKLVPQGDLQKPEGPLPVHNKNYIPLPQKDNEAHMKMLPPKVSLNKNEIMYQFSDAKPEQFVNSEVLSPWSGEVVEAFKPEQDRVHYKIKHDNNLVSVLNFKGESPLHLAGSRVLGGEKMGQMLGNGAGLTWKVTTLGPEIS